MIVLVRRALALFDRSTTRRFLLAIVGSTVIAVVEVLAVLLVVPLMQLITGGTASSSIVLLRNLTGNPSDSTLAAVLAAVVITAFIAKGLASLAIRWWTMGFINRRSADASRDLLRYYLQAPYSLHVKHGSPELLRRMNDAVGQVFSAVLLPSVTVVTESITIVAMMVAVFITAPIPALAVALYFGVAATILQKVVKERARNAGARILGSNLYTMRYALQALGGIKEIKLRNEQEVFVQKYAKPRMDAAMHSRTLAFLSELPKYAMEILFIIGVGLMTVLVYSGEPTDRALGILALFAVAGFRVMPSIARLLASMNVIRSGQYSLDLVEDDFAAARASRTVDAPPRGDKLALSSSLVVDDVRYRYDDGHEDVLRGISLEVPAGSSFAVVGHSGSGKSTLIDLLLGLRVPSNGRILADGVDVASRMPAWQSILAIVPQDVFLLEGSLRDNIHFSPDIDDPEDKRLWAALNQAQLREFVQALPDGLDTEMGERGVRLSGGQRQRVGIARALFRQPKLLVLDEATSALDNETERRITETMVSLKGKVTLIVVAHRLSTVRDCDQIAFMEHGQIAATGTFDEVRKKSTAFANLVRLGSLDVDTSARPSNEHPTS